MIAEGAARTIDVVMPQLGESVDTGTIARWHKAAGDAVEVDELFYEVSSDKVTMEVPSLVAGYVKEIVVAEGAEVPVGSVIARIGDAAEVARPRERLSPVVRRLLREHGLESSSLSGSKSGRITKADVLARAGSGAAPTAASAPAAATSNGSHRVPLSRSQLLAAERLSGAQKNAVNVFSVVEIDMEAVAEERARRKLTYLPFIAKAAIEALRSHEKLNASFDAAGSAIVYHDAVHLGVAVDLEDRGLVVPIVRNAEALTVEGLANEIARLADGARNSKLGPEAFADATFTITNNGAFGTLMTAPVLNAPNVAIVSTDAVELRPVIVNRAIAIRHRMYLCMTWDHRACDGSYAARFLTGIKKNLETWDWNSQ